MLRPIVTALSGAALLVSLAGGTALAGNPSGTGQPNASCEESTLEPHGFSSGGFANADLHYAGNPAYATAYEAAQAAYLAEEG